MQKTIPIAICGAGPVGQTLALLLHQRGVAAHDIVLIDAKTKEQAAQDARSIALSFGSQQILKSVQATVSNATPIQEIHVSRRAHFGRCLIQASDYALPALGYVAKYGDIVIPLEAAVAKANITILRPMQLLKTVSYSDHVALHFHHNAINHCQVLIQAEGGTFDDQAEGVQRHDYQQTAIICQVTCSQFQAHRAFERFTEEGPLALLPQGDAYSLVWCVRPETAEKLSKASEEEFLTALQTAFGGRVGQFLSASKRYTFSLGLNVQSTNSVKSNTDPRCLKIGNAAQTLHPVAGQGLNLGLRDAAVLADVIASNLAQSWRNNALVSEAISEVVSETVSEAQVEHAFDLFMQQRQTDRSTSIRITDSMARIFASSADGSLTQAALGLSLGALDILSPIKKRLAEQMMFGSRS